MAAGDAAAGDQQVVEPPWQQTAQRDVVGLAWRQTLQDRAAALGIVDVDRIGAARDHVVELLRLENVVGGEPVIAGDPAGLAHAGMDAALGDVGLLETGHAAAKECRDLAELPAALPFGMAPVEHVGAEHPGHPRAVDADLVLVRRAEEQDVLAWQVELAGRGRLADQIPEAVHAAPLVRMLAHVGLERRPLELDHAEHQGHRLDQAVLAADLVGCARLRGDVAIAGAVDHHARPQHDGSRLGLEHDAAAAAGPDHAARKRVQQQLHARLVEQIEHLELEQLRVEGDDVAGRERGRGRAAGRDQPAEQPRQHAGDHRLAGPVVGREQLGRPRPLEGRALGVERHQRHHQRRGSVAAEEAVALGEHDPGAGIGGPDRRADPGGAAADHQHVRLAADHRLARGQGDHLGPGRTRERRHVGLRDLGGTAQRAGLRLLEQTNRDRVARQRPLAQRRQGAADARLQRPPPVPGLVDVGDQLAGADLRERRHLEPEVVEEARDLGRVGQRRERHVLQAREDQKMQAHADREREVPASAPAAARSYSRL